MTTRNDVIVIGGGIVGLATALHLLQQMPGRRLVVIEKEPAVAQHQTGHNSGVIHSGLYYRPGSLKARLCVEGYNKLLDFCHEEQIPHEVCGKVVVALADSQVPQLDELERRGSANGLGGLRRLTPAEIREREPRCAGVAGLFVPHTGIVDYVAVAEAMARHIRALGGEIRLDEAVVTISPGEHEVRVHTTRGEHTCKFVVTCGGLQSDRLTRQTVSDLDLQILPFRG
ncbi:MAG: FAD-dependent oxidoreductase, partial [Actinobacteria bacterium]|nr:FAD-dependent oxidoreductase [Actinomycetota bacterium]